MIASKLYVSATLFKNTVDFYLGLGEKLTTELLVSFSNDNM